ncbi:hypothetical protein I3760_02G141500 [Carya illinoinensis]|nr:hypothetical protein I3760_02G141500 [Carya illinoinensis]
MYGGSSKLGRNGGGGAARGIGAKRPHSSHPLPPPHRQSGPAGAGRLSIGGRVSGSASNPRSRGSIQSAAPAAVEENFRLVSGNNPPAFAMIIRLAPDLVDEIKRLEAQAGTARIKFDVTASNSSGNVIDVGGKEFSFTCSRETGDLCDIYEECQSGEDGNGLLVESGCAWWKLNVKRVLDESTTKHVKMMSEEAERKLKARKAIVLDPGNPPSKSQIKEIAAVETNAWRPYKQKKEPAFKKRKVEPPQVGGLPKSAYKSGLSSTTTAKIRQTSPSLLSPPEQSSLPAAPLENANISKSHVTIEDPMPSQLISKVKAAPSSEKEIPTKTTNVVRETPGRKRNDGAKPMDLQSMLINLLTENPKGMSLKALEKAIGDTVPNSVKKIEPIIRKIATFQAPGRYFLKSKVELETLKKPLSESGSSPEDNSHQMPTAEDKHAQTRAAEPSFEEKVSPDELEEPGYLGSKLGGTTALANMEVQQHSPDLFGEKMGSDNSEAQAGSSSNSGSDSDSESGSSDSASDSGSHSKSRSPVGSGSGSSSDSESDASSNSKEGSDEDVDIMTSDDEKEPQRKLQPSEPGFSSSPILWKSTGGKTVQSGIAEKQDDQGSDAVEIEKDFLDVEHGTEMAVETSPIPDKEGGKWIEETKPFSPNHDDVPEHPNYAVSSFTERENAVKDSFKHEQSDSSERTLKGKPKRGSDVKHFKEKSDGVKRLKADVQLSISGVRDAQFSESSHNLSPDRFGGNPYKGPTILATNRAVRDGNPDIVLQKGFNQVFPGKSSSDFQQSGRRSFDQSTRAKAPDTAEKPDERAESGRKYSERNVQSFSVQKDKLYKDTPNDGYANEKKVSKNFKEGGSGGRQSVPFDSHYRKHGEGGQFLGSLMGSSPRDNITTGVNVSPVVNGKGSILQRELSDLELGELREPWPEETPVKKKLESKNSFKQSDNKPCSSDNWNSDSSKGKPVGKKTSESGKPSPHNLNSGLFSNIEGSNKKRNTEDQAEDLWSSHQRVVQSQLQPLSKVDHAEVVPQFNKLADGSNKSRQNEVKATQGFGLESYSESNKKTPVSAPQQHDAKRVVVSHSIKETKKQTSNTMVELTDGRKDSIWAEGNNSDRKRRDSSSDENSCSYSKYEKDEPELKGPIKDFSQYNEYVQDFRDKYDSYSSLNKILESYRNAFQKLEKDLNFAKGRDMERYNDIKLQLMDSYRQCGTKHKRLKKIFNVLHEELKDLKQRIKDFAVSFEKD